MTRLARTEFALSQVKTHLSKLPNRAPDIESFLVRYLTVSFYSEMEEQVKQVYKNRLHFTGDSRLQFFVSKTNDNMMQRVKKSDIKDFAKCFGEDCKSLFDDSLEQQDVAAYSSVISNRHNAAHGSGGTITVADVEKAIAAADRVLDSLENAIR